jgi:hypothetical protein
MMVTSSESAVWPRFMAGAVLVLRAEGERLVWSSMSMSLLCYWLITAGVDFNDYKDSIGAPQETVEIT